MFDFFSAFMVEEQSINDRINLIIKRERLTIAAFARKISIGDQTVRSVCVMKRNKPSFEFISNIVQTFDWLNPRWLITGEGSMDVAGMSEPAAGAADLRPLIDYMREKDVKTSEFLREKDRKIEELIVETTEWRMKYELSNRLKSAR